MRVCLSVSLAVFGVIAVGGCRAAKPQPASPAGPVEVAAPDDAAGVLQADAAVPPADAGPPRVTCVVYWPNHGGEPALGMAGSHFSGREGVCGTIQITFSSLMSYRWAGRRIGTVKKRFQSADPSVQVTVEFGREPVAVYRTRDELLANSSIPVGLIPKSFDFSKRSLVQLKYARMPLTQCRDGMLGLTGAQARARRAGLKKRAARAKTIASKWALLASQPIATAEGFVLVRRGVARNPNPGMCKTSYVWQPALAPVAKSGAPIRVID